MGVATARTSKVSTEPVWPKPSREGSEHMSPGAAHGFQVQTEKCVIHLPAGKFVFLFAATYRKYKSVFNINGQ